MPQSEERVQAGLETLHRCAHEFDLEVFHVREMPVDNSRLGPYAKSTEPRHYQIFVRDADSSKAPREEDEPLSSAELKGSVGEGPNHSNHSNNSNHSNSFKMGIFPRKFKNFRKFQHFLTYRRNSDKISSKSEQKSVKRIRK